MRKRCFRIAGAMCGAFLVCGLAVLPVFAENGTWKNNEIGYWYEHTDGGYTRDGWEKIDGKWYYFDGNGYMKTGWLQIGEEWFYLDPQGAMVTGEQQVNGVWYRFDDESGEMLLGWQKVNGAWAYYNKSGNRVENPEQEAGSLKGIDVSVYQGQIDWNAVKNDGIQFAFVRAGHGDHKLDTRYRENMAGANAAGIPVGVYFYSTARSEIQAITDAQFVIDNMAGYLVSYPVVVDVEDRALQGDLSKDQVTKIAKAFCDEIRRAGYTPMVYCDEDWYRSKIDISQLQGVEMWVARYASSYDSSISRSVWQCGSTGRINGIAGRVDIDFGYKDYTQLIPARTGAVEGYTKTTGNWQLNGSGWWFQHFDGTWPANTWEAINGAWYRFDMYGYMITGWYWNGANWYYLNPSGDMALGWKNLNGTWYYLNAPNGEMATGWINLNGTWYLLDASGAMQTGWYWNGANWYYLNPSGDMAVGWINLNGTWYYLTGSGAMATGWQNVNGTWYYLTSSGAMATGWQYLNGTWYYLNESGAMLTGWQNLGGTWYYMDESGAMAANTWVGDYYVDASGAWTQTR